MYNHLDLGASVLMFAGICWDNSINMKIFLFKKHKKIVEKIIRSNKTRLITIDYNLILLFLGLLKIKKFNGFNQNVIFVHMPPPQKIIF